MEQVFFDEIGKDGLRYITGWGKHAIAFSVKDKVAFWNPSRIYYHLNDKKRQIESIQDGHSDFWKFRLLKKITIPKQENRNKTEILLFERDKKDESPFVFMCLIISGDLFYIDYKSFDKEKNQFEKTKKQFLCDLNPKDKEFEKKVNEILDGLRKEQIENIDIFTRVAEEDRKKMTYSEAELEELKCSVLVVCKKCKKEIVDFFDCNFDSIRPKTTQIAVCRCGAKYEISIEAKIKTTAIESKY